MMRAVALHSGGANVALVMFGKPLLNNVLAFDHVPRQKRSDCWEFWMICQYFRVCQTLAVLG